MTNNFVKKLLSRLFTSVVVLLIVISFIFILLQLSPGNPSLKYLSPRLSSEALTDISNSFKSDKNVSEQYYSFITSFVKGDLGISLNFREPVLNVISEYLLFTVLFSLSAFIIQLFVSFFAAYKSSLTPGGMFDKIVSKLSMVTYSTPSFVSGIFLIYILAYKLGIFPISGVYSTNYYQFNLPEKIFDVVYHLFLPCITLVITLFPIYYKYLRDNLKSVINSPMVLKLQSLGLKNRTILIRHVIPNAINPVVAIAGIELGSLLGGTLLIEVIFGLPGMGRLTLNAIFALDYPLIIGCCFTAGIMVIISGFLSDIVRILIDKRLLRGLLN